MRSGLGKGLTMNRTKVIRNLSFSLLLAAGVSASPAYAQVSFNINFAPPAPQHEIVPALSPGYVWAPGYWGWTGERHVWVRGRPIMQRQGYAWAPDRWDTRDGRYYRTAGHWEQDRSYKPVKMKKEKKETNREHDDRGNNGNGNNGKHGRGG
jgi:hypothetical protein